MRGFPNYDLIDPEVVDAAAEKTGRLEGLYRKTQTNAWDGKAVLKAIIEKHGGVRVAAEKREPLAKVFSIILWGELAAWTISAEIAEQVDDVEAKMAATGQAFDEARHFTVMRDYLRELGIPIPPLDGFTRTILTKLLDERDVVKKIVGMQLLVENIALNLFRMVRKTGIEPVLGDLLPYFERDEARHVGLGVLYLPTLLRRLGPVETLSLMRFQFEIFVLMAWGVQLLRGEFMKIGVDFGEAVKDGLGTQGETFKRMVAAGGGKRRYAARGIYAPSFVRRLNHLVIDATFPPPSRDVPWWHEKILRAESRVARTVNRALLARLALKRVAA
ncbi:MAG: ferritin-like domain-containing protein [Deltaproteobacteria bacterium]|nr:ferritin-like domain-containing protein [Deltaproteobacteria bacterium]